MIKWEQVFLHTRTGKTSLRGKQSLQGEDNGMVVKKLHGQAEDSRSIRSINESSACSECYQQIFHTLWQSRCHPLMDAILFHTGCCQLQLIVSPWSGLLVSKSLVNTYNTVLKTLLISFCVCNSV